MTKDEALTAVEELAKRDRDTLFRLHGFCQGWQTQLPIGDWNLLEELGVLPPNTRRLLPTTFIEAILASDKVPKLACGF